MIRNITNPRELDTLPQGTMVLFFDDALAVVAVREFPENPLEGENLVWIISTPWNDARETQSRHAMTFEDSAHLVACLGVYFGEEGYFEEFGLVYGAIAISPEDTDLAYMTNLPKWSEARDKAELLATAATHREQAAEHIRIALELEAR